MGGFKADVTCKTQRERKPWGKEILEGGEAAAAPDAWPQRPHLGGSKPYPKLDGFDL